MCVCENRLSQKKSRADFPGCRGFFPPPLCEVKPAGDSPAGRTQTAGTAAERTLRMPAEVRASRVHRHNEGRTECVRKIGPAQFCCCTYEDRSGRLSEVSRGHDGRRISGTLKARGRRLFVQRPLARCERPGESLCPNQLAGGKNFCLLTCGASRDVQEHVGKAACIALWEMWLHPFSELDAC